MISCVLLLIVCSDVYSEIDIKDDGVKQSDAYISLIALGAEPSRRYRFSAKGEVKSDKSHAIDTKKHAVLLTPQLGDIPPSALYYQSNFQVLSKAGAEEKKESGGEGVKGKRVEKRGWKRLALTFNRSAGIQKISSDRALPLFLRDRKLGGSEGKFVKYLSLPALPAASHTLMFLLPASKNGRDLWGMQPVISGLRVNSKSMLDKHLVVRNFSNQSVKWIVEGAKPLVLRPGQRKSFKIDRKKIYYSVTAETDGRHPIQLCQMRVKVSSRVLQVIAFYNANPQTNGGKGIGVLRTSVIKHP